MSFGTIFCLRYFFGVLRDVWKHIYKHFAFVCFGILTNWDCVGTTFISHVGKFSINQVLIKYYLIFPANLVREDVFLGVICETLRVSFFFLLLGTCILPIKLFFCM